MDANYQFIFLGLFIVLFLIPAIFFLITQQETLKRVQPHNRLMRPGQVWLQMIPIFGMIWQYFVVSRISDSIQRELQSQTFSFEAEHDAPLYTDEPRPTYGMGITYCILFTAGILPIPVLESLLTLAGFVCWIIYWVQLNSYKKKLEQKLYSFAPSAEAS